VHVLCTCCARGLEEPHKGNRRHLSYAWWLAQSSMAPTYMQQTSLAPEKPFNGCVKFIEISYLDRDDLQNVHRQFVRIQHLSSSNRTSRTASIAAIFMRFIRSAPEKPAVARDTLRQLIFGSKRFPFECTLRMSMRPSTLGYGT
jgi:hypothetical protein